jgi:large subunit ribosomal protein L28
MLVRGLGQSGILSMRGLGAISGNAFHKGFAPGTAMAQLVMQSRAPLSRSMAKVTPSGRFVQTRTPGYGTNVHRSNRAKEGLFHGKDLQFGHMISHSMEHSKRRWLPNIKSKRVWSISLDNWVRFKVSTRALRAIDDCGGIDNYLLQLDNRLVADSNYVTKMRDMIATTVYYQGKMSDKIKKKLGYDKCPPAPIEASFDPSQGKYGRWNITEKDVEGHEGEEFMLS